MSVIDALEYHGKISCGLSDQNNTPLFLGDTVDKRGAKYLVGYRYGKFVLLPMMASCYIGVEDGGNLTKLNEVTATTDQWLIIGYKSEPFFEELKTLIGE